MTKATIETLACALLFSAAPAAAEPCELHVWPTKDLRGGKVGDFPINASDGVVAGVISELGGKTENQVAILDALLNPAAQVAQFDKLDLRVAFGLPAETKIVYHEPIADNWNAKARNSEATADCYYEFRMEEIWFNRHPIYGRDITTRASFRKFGVGEKIEMKSKTSWQYASSKMRGFPKEKIKSDAASIAIAADFVNRAFVNDLQIFTSRIKAHLQKKP